MHRPLDTVGVELDAARKRVKPLRLTAARQQQQRAAA
jgi:hypothetical protein